jgi:hypothetical protein
VVFGDVARFAFDLLAQADDLAAVFAAPPRPVQVGEFSRACARRRSGVSASLCKWCGLIEAGCFRAS